MSFFILNAIYTIRNEVNGPKKGEDLERFLGLDDRTSSKVNEGAAAGANRRFVTIAANRVSLKLNEACLKDKLFYFKCNFVKKFFTSHILLFYI